MNSTPTKESSLKRILALIAALVALWAILGTIGKHNLLGDVAFVLFCIVALAIAASAGALLRSRLSGRTG